MLSGHLPHAYLEPGDFTWMSSLSLTRVLL